jgi:hypothetical protein
VLKLTAFVQKWKRLKSIGLATFDEHGGNGNYEIWMGAEDELKNLDINWKLMKSLYEKVPLTNSQKLSTCSCPEPGQSNSHNCILSLQDPSQYFTPTSVLVFPVVSFPLAFPPITVMYFWFHTAHSTGNILTTLANIAFSKLKLHSRVNYGVVAELIATRANKRFCLTVRCSLIS